jgi:hypothetical protein
LLLVACQLPEGSTTVTLDKEAAPLYKPDTTETRLHRNHHSKADKKKNGSNKKRATSLRTVTARPVSEEERCPCMFTFRWEPTKNHWFLKPGFGCSKHRFHDKIPEQFMPFRPSLMTDEDATIVQQSERAGVNSGAKCSLLLERTNALPSTSQCARMAKKGTCQDGNKREDADAHLKQLQADPKVSMIAIYHHVDESDLIAIRSKGRPKLKVKAYVTEAGSNDESAKRATKMMELQVEDDYQKDMQSFVMGCMDENTKSGQKILLASAWTNDDSRRLFELFPEFSTMDTSSQTNKTGLPLAMLCGRDHNGKSFIAVQCFLPNECKWAFHWFWSKAVPTLLGKAIQRMVLIVTDGDDKLYDPLLHLIPQLYPNAQHKLCVYHLVIQKLAGLRLHNADNLYVKYSCHHLVWGVYRRS